MGLGGYVLITNRSTAKDTFLVLVVEVLLDELVVNYTTKRDLRSRYHQVRMHEEDVLKIAFKTH